MPSWGRPPGAKGSRRRRQWERENEQAQRGGFWNNNGRVEELDSDDTDTQGVGLNYGKRRFVSDPLQYLTKGAGGEASSSRARETYAFGDSDDSESEDSEVSEVDGTDALQIALRDKEEALVQSALARIRRAQEKGKREVKLNKDELEALENRRKRMQAAATTKARKGSGGSGGGSDREKRRSERISIPIAAATESLSRPSSRPSSRRDKGRAPHPAAAANPPGMLVAGPDGLAYAPSGTYPSNAIANTQQQSQPQGRNSPSRPRSNTASSSQHQSRGNPPPIPYFQHQSLSSGNARHFSDGMRPPSSSSNISRRPLPDEADWRPVSRRSSVASSQGFVVDPFDYQVASDPSPPISREFQYQSQSQGQAQTNRRIVSNPSDVAYSSVRRIVPPGFASKSQSQFQRAPITSSSSDPSLATRQGLRPRSSRNRGPGAFDSDSYEEPEEEEDEDESDELGNGVQVFVDENDKSREKGKGVAKKPVGKKKGKGK
ncbi:uncharacterized protein RAG0_07188 [Rhynchosporium agropyri]|uniref:Prenylated Rab acceptor 1 n=1 Tax=Rhynchosporium agropyri TaxID=914238 RepID=A0A1E1KKB2_9HELO|nr:uncharacterized protein RAG0_07188 [Rhynchosporium agropyri]